MTSDDIDERLRALIADILGLSPERRDMLAADSGLFGTLPELDSMSVASLLTEIEDRFGIMIDDDDVDGELFATFGNLSAFVRRKLDTRTR